MYTFLTQIDRQSPSKQKEALSESLVLLFTYIGSVYLDLLMIFYLGAGICIVGIELLLYEFERRSLFEEVEVCY